MSNNFSFSASQISGQYSKFTEKNDEWSKSVQKAMEAARNLTNTWKGQASTEFLAAVEGANTNYNALQEHLRLFCEFLNSTKSRYDQNESEVSGIIKKLGR